MLTCDICKLPIEGRRDIARRIKLSYEFSCKTFQKREFDICSACESVLNTAINQTQCDFVNGITDINKNTGRKARWKGAGLGDYYCSLCNEQFSGGDHYKYCPECGAKMYD